MKMIFQIQMVEFLRRNQEQDTLTTRFSSIDAWYSKACGILRGLELLGYGYYGSSNLDALIEFERRMTKKKPTRKEQNFKWLMGELEREVLEEEGYHTDNRCEFCLKTYGQDDRTIIDEKGRKNGTKTT
jgi:hypothetical protein